LILIHGYTGEIENNPLGVTGNFIVNDSRIASCKASDREERTKILARRGGVCVLDSADCLD
jgi:hypothetical protein